MAFFFITIAILIILIIYKKSNISKKNNILKHNKEFLINKVQYYSTVSAISNTTNYQNPEWNLKVYQYTDIAIYLDRLNKSINEENYITNLELRNFKLNDYEKEEIYYLNPRLFGKNTLDFDIKIEDALEYNVINSSNSENDQEYNIPIYFQDCSNPVTFRYVNYLANNFRVANNETLKYNGSLIPKLGLTLEKLNDKLSFEIKIVTKDGNERIGKINLKIPYKNESHTIIDGDFETKERKNIQF